MTVTIGAVSTNWASPLNLNKKAGLAVHEIAGSDDAYVQTTGRLNEAYPYELLVEDAERALLSGYANAPETTLYLSDTVAGISAQAVRIDNYSEVQEVPGLWRVQIVLVKKPI